ncbi:efflux RND transporter periplasmic adaptor subunit [Pollutimonas harenae]|uniref:Efflux RND transporter periplasmic adaptor subunit n=1 Tax=Pollutimonas harenae TaxID=657015 RepID=A0A853GSK8_9BURK|nr:efflux RND transporter periplasmic adaptor subunit [Pollutimonas harenae]NYT86098.1 efflux RND transporter periplasmic adaptor subunit [Pollutimonas harenae]TEA71143.1 efflux RND transporter periplasmic adaptor subunit [Pollutimonas harenae]
MPNLLLPSRRQGYIVALSSMLLLAACGEKPQQGAGDMKVPVSVVTVQPSRTEIFVELPGRVQAIKDAQIRARVTGIVTAINFEQGSDVKDGQLLFTIDPAPYAAERAQAYAQLKNAEAEVRSARLLAERYSKLIKANAVSRQEYDNAVAQSGQAEAAVAAAKAALQVADINLGYTKVVSPIDGRIGRSLVTEGALVSAAEATQMALVQQLDRVYVDVNRSTSELATLRRALADGILTQSGDGNAVVQALLEDGTPYANQGKLLFSGVTVDPGTGQVNMRAEFPNPNQILLPGMYVRVRVPQGVDEKALKVPQQAVQRTADGRSSLIVVREGKAQTVPVSTGMIADGQTLITKGLKAGDQVVVEGFQKIRPGAPVQPTPWKQNAQAAGGQGAAAAPKGEQKAAPAKDGAETKPAEAESAAKPADESSAKSAD